MDESLRFFPVNEVIGVRNSDHLPHRIAAVKAKFLPMDMRTIGTTPIGVLAPQPAQFLRGY